MPTPTPATRRDISRTVSASKNLRTISNSLVQKLRTSDGISSTVIANQLASDAIKDLVTALNVSEKDLMAVEKNIRRRLYDSLKVLVSIGAIRRRSDKILQWQGVTHLIPTKFQPTIPKSPTGIPNLTRSLNDIRNRVSTKSLALKHLADQVQALEHLNTRNRTTTTPTQSQKLYLPFVLVRTPSTSEIKLETTKDARSLSFHFSQPFEVINDYNILDRIFFVTDYTNHMSDTLALSHNIQLHTPQKRVVLASHSLQTPERLADELPSPASLIGSARKRQALNGKLSVTPRRSPKRRRISGISQFAKYTSGEKPPRSPGTPLLRGPRGKKPLRRVMIRSPLQASLRALADSPLQRNCNEMASRTPERLSQHGDECHTPESMLRRSLRDSPVAKNGDRLAESLLRSPEVRSSGPLKKRIYGPGRNFLTRDSGDVHDDGDFGSDELLDNADIMLTPGMSPLHGFSSRSSYSPMGARRVARRLFSND